MVSKPIAIVIRHSCPLNYDLMLSLVDFLNFKSMLTKYRMDLVDTILLKLQHGRLHIRPSEQIFRGLFQLTWLR